MDFATLRELVSAALETAIGRTQHPETIPRSGYGGRAHKARFYGESRCAIARLKDRSVVCQSTRQPASLDRRGQVRGFAAPRCRPQDLRHNNDVTGRATCDISIVHGLAMCVCLSASERNRNAVIGPPAWQQARQQASPDSEIDFTH